MTNSETFEKELGYIENEECRAFVATVLNSLPDYFRKIGASTSGRFHPAYTLGEGGLVRHVQAAVGIAKQLFRAEIYCFDDFDKDVVISALILHDGLKCGMWEDKTAFNHPILMSNFVYDAFDNETCKLKRSDYNALFIDRVSGCIASHMGKWNKNPEWEVTLPLPITDIQKCVHLCDYIASRKCLEYNFEVECPD